jgi:hypothetical protein
MKRNRTKLLWAAAGCIGSVMACGMALYKTVLTRMEKRFESHCEEIALQTLEGEGGIVFD